MIAPLLLLALAQSDTAPPVITHVKIANAPIGRPIAVRARIEDEGEVFAPSVYVRAVGSESFEAIPMKKVEDGFEAIIPAEQVTKTIEYFIEAFDEQGNGPAREGTPEQPIRVLVFEPGGEAPPPPPPPPGIEPPVKTETDAGGGIVSKWWFWTLIVGVAVAGAATAIVLTTRSGPVDAVDVTVHAPDPTEGL